MKSVMIFAVALMISGPAWSQSILAGAKTCAQAHKICVEYCAKTYGSSNGLCSNQCASGKDECARTGCYKTQLTSDCGFKQ